MSRLESLIDKLQIFYGALPSPPHDPFGLFVWEVLSVHSTPRKRDAALAAFTRAKTMTPDAMWKAPQKILEDSAALAGPYREQRLRALRTGVEVFRRSSDLPKTIRGPLSSARRALKGLPQMGEGGAYRMLLFGASHPVLPVDARIGRVALRLGYGERHKDFAKTARSVRSAVRRELPQTADVYRRVCLYLSNHGATACTEADPHCQVCPLLEDCDEGQRRNPAH